MDIFSLKESFAILSWNQWNKCNLNITFKLLALEPLCTNNLESKFNV